MWMLTAAILVASDGAHVFSRVARANQLHVALFSLIST